MNGRIFSDFAKKKNRKMRQNISTKLKNVSELFANLKQKKNTYTA